MLVRIFNVFVSGKLVKSGTLAECRKFVLRRTKTRTRCVLIPQ